MIDLSYDEFAVLRYEFEDELPHLSDKDYKQMFPVSKIIHGVRMFPYVEIDDKRYYLKNDLNFRGQ